MPKEGALEGDALHSEAAEHARYGETDELRAAIARGADVNWRGPGGNTALHMVGVGAILLPGRCPECMTSCPHCHHLAIVQPRCRTTDVLASNSLPA